jgi:hypothetical protein
MHIIDRKLRQEEHVFFFYQEFNTSIFIWLSLLR